MKLYSFRFLLFLAFFCLFAAQAWAQTISVPNFDNTLIYSPGSSIAVPFLIDNSSGSCITQTNTFNLYLSDANGVYTASPLASVSGFYATFINATIPSLPNGTGYKVKVTSSSNPGATILESAPFTITSGATIQAGINSTATLATGVFGKCDRTAATFQLDYTNASTTGTNGLVEFINESDGTNSTNPGFDGSFTANQTNYTIVVKATNGLVYGTKAYTLLNNPVNNNLGSSASTSACLSTGGGALLNYTIDVNPLQLNFPGDTYKVTWGDGATTTYTLCDIINGGKTISHTYTSSSCGHDAGPNEKDVFEVDIQPISPYCSLIGTISTSYASISITPTNAITGPSNACTTSATTFTNASYAGQDPNSTSCAEYTGARYNWYVDNITAIPALANVPKGTKFSPNLSAGFHTIYLRRTSASNITSCPVGDASFTICVQAPPTPTFQLAPDPNQTTFCISGGNVTVGVANTTTVAANNCYVNPFTWSITKGSGNSAVTVPVLPSTDNNPNPSFSFTDPGIYTISLNMKDACGNSISPAPTKQIVVSGSPTVNFASAAQQPLNYCGAQTLTFDNTAGSLTQVIYGGTPDPAYGIYQWQLPAGASFVNSTNSSQYPTILFPTAGMYTVGVTHSNTICGGSESTTLLINIQQAPEVKADPSASETVCPQTPSFTFNGYISDRTNVLPNGVTWTKSGNGDGTLSFPDNDLDPVYTFGSTDKQGGKTIRFTLDVKTNLATGCNDIPVYVDIIIPPLITISGSHTAPSICDGAPFNYTISSNDANATYAWTVNSTTNLTGAANGSGGAINDPLALIDHTITGSVTYTITPTSNGCNGTPFDYKVNINPIPVINPPASVSICSGTSVNAAVGLPSNLTYTWTATASSPNVTGYHTITAAGPMNESLTNAGTTDETVTYVFTPIGANGCPGAPSNPVVVTIHPQPTPADADRTVPGPNNSVNGAICDQGPATTFPFNAYPPSVGTGMWSLQSGPPGVVISFDDPANPQAKASGFVPGTYVFRWTITSPTCGFTTDDITVTDYATPVGGTAAADVNPICYGSDAILKLTGQTGNVIRWEQSINNGGFSTVPGTSTGTTYTYTGLTQTTTFQAVVTNGACNTPTFSNPVTVTVNPLTPQALINGSTAPSLELCNQSNVALIGNQEPGTTGAWTLTSGQTGVTFDDATNPNVTVNGLVGGQTYKIQWTLTGSATCPTTSAVVTITDRPPIDHNQNIIQTPGNNSLVCAGSILNFTASNPTGGSGTYTYQWQSSTDNGATWADISGQTAKDATGVTIQNQNTAYRRIVKSGTCNDASAPITINIEAAIGDNTLPISAEICYNTVPGEIVGSQPTGGDNVSYTYQWQQSTNANSGYTDILNSDNINYTPPTNQPLLVTTYYRRIVSSSVCSGATSNTSAPIKVIVDPEIKANFTAQITGGCAPFNLNQLVNGTSNIIIAGDPNIKTYTWYADNNKISESSTSAFPGYSLNTDGQSVVITLTVTNTLGCQDSHSITFTAINRVTAGLTMTNISANPSGAQTYQLTNTSAPANAATYLWDFGDGTTSTATTPPNHVFAADEANGTDKVYEAKLTATTLCSVNSASQQITVYPSTPHALIDPGILTGCAPYTITARNLSPGTNSNYTFYLYDGATLVQQITKTDKSDVSFNSVSPLSTKTYTLYMVATNIYGVTGQSITYPVTVNPSSISANMTVLGTGSDAVGCAPFNVTFQNLSNGGTSYVYNIYDSGQNAIAHIPTNSTADQSYAFNTPGTYYVDLSVISNCTTAQSPGKIKITVNALPSPDFATDAAASCIESTVSFTNNTPDAPGAPAASYTYLWDFGDGTTSNLYTPPPHTYDYTRSPYTVTLTATNPNGCSATITKEDFITVNPGAGTDFAARPDTITSIPNYHFSFADQSTGASVSWNWDFGDGSSSTEHSPEHTYADTGKYIVTLTTTTAAGCSGTKKHTVQITGVPGQLYVPNAFMPTSLNTELMVFTVKGSGIKQWDMRIYDNWGTLIFETTKLNNKGEPMEFWDGRYKGQEMQQGGYAWDISATFINGTDWRGMSYKGSAPKKAGVVNLIR